MKGRYKIIVYNHGKRVKLIKTYQTYGNAIKKYRSILSNNVVYFPKEILWDGVDTDYELALTAPKQNKGIEYFRDELGTLIQIISKGDFVIKQLNPYYIEESFKDKLRNKLITFKDLVKYLMGKKQSTSVIYIINNKLVIEYFENEDMDLFILKNNKTANLLLETLKGYNTINGITNFIYFNNPTLENKSRLYIKLEDRYNINKQYMQRVATH